MFPVPQHLPRAGEGETQDAGPSSSLSRPTASKIAPDPVLDILQPLLTEGDNGSSSYTAQQVSRIRRDLENALKENKARTHDLLINNFPAVSSHIQLSTELQANIDNVQTKLSQLKKGIDPSNSETSFLPPVVSLLNKHFTSLASGSSARAHSRALKALRNRTSKLKKLEEAVWSGRGADESVVLQLQSEEENGYELDEGEEALSGTKVIKSIEVKYEALRAFAVEQITDGYQKAVSFSSPSPKQQNAAISVQTHISLQQPRTTRPAHIASSPLSQHPYSLPEIYLALSRLNLLVPLLQILHNRVLRELVQPVLTGRRRTDESSTENLAILRLESASDQSPSEILSHISTILNFIDNTAFPSSSSPPPPPERRFFIDELHRAVFTSVLDNLILPSLPPTLSEVPSWLQILERGVDVENSFSPPPSKPVLKTFYENKAGIAWATQRRYGVADDVRKLILSGWEGWEAEEKEREREVVILVEVEVDEDEDTVMADNQDESFGWGFEDGSEAVQKSTLTEAAGGEAPVPPGDEIMQAEDGDGWGFEESTNAAAGPSSQSSSKLVPALTEPATNGEEEIEEDGWDLDPSPPSATTPTTTVQASPPKPVIAPAKPAREAKRLGKKVAKVRTTEDEYDPWGSGSESMAESSSRQSFSSDLPASQNKTAPFEPTPPEPIVHTSEAVATDGWGWDEAASPPKQASLPQDTGKREKRKRKELREEKRKLKERYLVSVACERLADMARGVLTEIEKLRSSSLSSPSFGPSTSTPVLLDSIADVFALYRALLPTHFASQLRDVPAIAMQAFNDAAYLSTVLLSLPNSDAEAIDAESARLLALAEYIFASQLELQTNGIMEALDDLGGLQETGDEKVFRKADRGIKGVVHNLESLARVLKPVVTRSTHTQILGELISTLCARMTDDILALGDITEVESNRLTELLKVVQSLEGVFEQEDAVSGGPGRPGGAGGAGGIVQNVRGWLKFCYVAEILQANLVDITYLLDQGSLIDFTPDELANLVRALFASSEKRDGVIDRILQHDNIEVTH